VKTIPGKKAGGSIGSVFKDKRVLIGVAAAGGLGLVVLLRKGNGDQSATDGSTTQPQAYSSSDFDTYNAISQLGSAWTQQLQGIQDSLDQLGQAPPVGGGTTTTPPTTKPPVTTIPVPKPKPKPVTKPAPKKSSALFVNATKYTTASAARGSNWESTLSTIAGHYHTTVGNLLKLNPSIKNANQIRAGQKIRYK
jgi:LysM domain